MAVARDTVANRIPEWRLQAEACAGLDELQTAGLAFEYAASLEGAKRSRRQQQDASVTGMKAGEPDLRIYLAGGSMFFIELKGKDGRLNAAQKVRFPKLRALGFVIHIMERDSAAEMRAAVCAIVRKELLTAE